MNRAESGLEPRRETFVEEVMPAEPNSDVKLVTASGMVLRERVRKVEGGGGISLQFTYTRLDDSGVVLVDGNGEPLISPTHEIAFSGENAARIDPEAAILGGREIAAARAVDHFAGLAKLGDVMSGRLA